MSFLQPPRVKPRASVDYSETIRADCGHLVYRLPEFVKRGNHGAVTLYCDTCKDQVTFKEETKARKKVARAKAKRAAPRKPKPLSTWEQILTDEGFK